MSDSELREAELRLCAAAEMGDVYEVMRLLGAGVPIDCTNERQQTPLMLSCTNPHAIRATEVLLEAGADIDATTTDLQMTPLLYACKDNNVAALKLLLQLGANPCITDISRRTCFHYAVLSCPPPLVRELNARTKGVFLNAADSSGYTPLMLAAEHGRVDTARDLLDMGANPLLRNKLNHQAIELADWFGQKRIVEELEAWFKRSGLTMRGERVDDAAGGAGSEFVGGRPVVPASPAGMGTPVPGLMSPALPPATPSSVGGIAGGGIAGGPGAGPDTARGLADAHAHAPDPVGMSLAASGSTVPFLREREP